ncbi:MAG: signal peptidase I [candidate division SR1 bacterium]|nr:signal peptidase I [candidate division SR1 bacterium]
MPQSSQNPFNITSVTDETASKNTKETEFSSNLKSDQNFDYTKKKASRADLVWSLIWIFTISLLILKFAVYQQVNVIGESMEPNFSTGQMLLVNTINKNIKRGQVTAVYEDKDAGKNSNYFTRFNTKFYLKRVIGLPNEEIEIIGSTVIIYNSENPDGFALKENYVGSRAKLVEDQKKYYFAKTKIPSDSYFVMGDNRSNSTDSRVRGSFPVYDIFGQETLKYWPLEKAELFHLPEYPILPLSDSLKSIRDEYKTKYSKSTV